MRMNHALSLPTLPVRNDPRKEAMNHEFPDEKGDFEAALFAEGSAPPAPNHTNESAARADDEPKMKDVEEPSQDGDKAEAVSDQDSSEPATLVFEGADVPAHQLTQVKLSGVGLASPEHAASADADAEPVATEYEVITFGSAARPDLSFGESQESREDALGSGESLGLIKKTDGHPTHEKPAKANTASSQTVVDLIRDVVGHDGNNLELERAFSESGNNSDHEKPVADSVSDPQNKDTPALTSISETHSRSTALPSDFGANSTRKSRILLSQIAVMVSKSDAGDLDVEWSPDELGNLKISISKGDRMTVTIYAERPDTLDLLRKNADNLQRELRDLGVSNYDLDFRQNNSNSKENHQNSKYISNVSTNDFSEKNVNSSKQKAAASGQYMAKHTIFGNIDIRF